MPVEMPEALSPDAMSALVSKLDEEQTEALTKLIKLLNNTVSQSSISLQTLTRPWGKL